MASGRITRPPTVTHVIEIGDNLSHLLHKLLGESSKQHDVINGLAAQLQMLIDENREVKQLLRELIEKGEIMAANLKALEAEVARNTEVDASAIVLLNGLAAKIESLKTDPVALQQLADSLKGSSDSLAAAIVANTPAEPEPTE